MSPASGQSVLTWFQSGGSGAEEGPAGPGGPIAQAGPGPSGPTGTDCIYNDRYQEIASLQAGNGDATNFHEFLITPRDTALITAGTVTTANLTSIGGPADQWAIDGIVQLDRLQGQPAHRPVGWGSLPYISEFSPSGKLLFNAKLPAGVSTYRAYLLPWHPAI